VESEVRKVFGTWIEVRKKWRKLHNKEFMICKKQVKFTPGEAMKAKTASRGVALVFL
jgi:hypothetical protein